MLDDRHHAHDPLRGYLGHRKVIYEERVSGSFCERTALFCSLPCSRDGSPPTNIELPIMV